MSDKASKCDNAGMVSAGPNMAFKGEKKMDKPAVEKGGYSPGGIGFEASMAPKQDADKRMTLMKKPLKLTKKGKEFVKACGGFLQKEKPVTTGGPDDKEEIPLMPHEIRSMGLLDERGKKAVAAAKAKEKLFSEGIGRDPKHPLKKADPKEEVNAKHRYATELINAGHADKDDYKYLMSMPVKKLQQEHGSKIKTKVGEAVRGSQSKGQGTHVKHYEFYKAFEDRWVLAISDQMKKAATLHKFPFEFKVNPSGSQRDYLFKVGACEVVYSVMGSDANLSIRHLGVPSSSHMAIAKTLYTKILMAHNQPLVKADPLTVGIKAKHIASFPHKDTHTLVDHQVFGPKRELEALGQNMVESQRGMKVHSTRHNIGGAVFTHMSTWQHKDPSKRVAPAKPAPESKYTRASGEALTKPSFKDPTRKSVLTPKGEEMIKKLYGSNYARTWMEGLGGQDLRREKRRMSMKRGYATKKPVKNRASYRLRTQNARLMGFMEEKIGKAVAPRAGNEHDAAFEHHLQHMHHHEVYNEHPSGAPLSEQHRKMAQAHAALSQNYKQVKLHSTDAESWDHDPAWEGVPHGLQSATDDMASEMTPPRQFRGHSADSKLKIGKGVELTPQGEGHGPGTRMFGTIHREFKHVGGEVDIEKSTVPPEGGWLKHFTEKYKGASHEQLHGARVDIHHTLKIWDKGENVGHPYLDKLLNERDAVLTEIQSRKPKLTKAGEEFVKAFGLNPQQAKLKHTPGTSLRGRTNIAARAGKPVQKVPGLVKPKAPAMPKRPSVKPPTILKAIGAAPIKPKAPAMKAPKVSTPKLGKAEKKIGKNSDVAPIVGSGTGQGEP